VISPLLRGMLGLEVDAPAKRARFAPHFPADWTSVEVKNVQVGGCVLQLAYRKSNEGIRLQVTRTGNQQCTLEFAPAVSMRATVVGAELDGHSLPVRSEVNSQDQHASVQFPVRNGSQTVLLRVHDDFGLTVRSALPPLGSESRGLRVTSEVWSSERDRLTLEVSGASATAYMLPVWHAEEIANIQGGEIINDDQGQKLLRVAIPKVAEPYGQQKVVIQFASKARARGAGR
jgi:hypothetical protein